MAFLFLIVLGVIAIIVVKVRMHDYHMLLEDLMLSPNIITRLRESNQSHPLSYVLPDCPSK